MVQAMAATDTDAQADLVPLLAAFSGAMGGAPPHAAVAALLRAEKATHEALSPSPEPSRDQARAMPGPEAAPPAPRRAPDGGADVADNGMLDLLEEVMDAWEQAVTQRLHDAIAGAVRGARSDVMQACPPLPQPFFGAGTALSLLHNHLCLAAILSV